MFAPNAPLIRSRIDTSTVLPHRLPPQTLILLKLPWDLGRYVRTVIQTEKTLMILVELPLWQKVKLGDIYLSLWDVLHTFYVAFVSL